MALQLPRGVVVGAATTPWRSQRPWRLVRLRRPWPSQRPWRRSSAPLPFWLKATDACLPCRLAATWRLRSSPWPGAGGDQGRVGGHACGGHLAGCASAFSSTGKATSHDSPSMLEQGLALVGALQLRPRRAGARPSTVPFFYFALSEVELLFMTLGVATTRPGSH